jgi:hypothetical protein
VISSNPIIIHHGLKDVPGSVRVGSLGNIVLHIRDAGKTYVFTLRRAIALELVNILLSNLVDVYIEP